MPNLRMPNKRRTTQEEGIMPNPSLEASLPNNGPKQKLPPPSKVVTPTHVLPA